MQDKRGFIWIGTDDGLNRYDGNRFQVFRHEPANPASISGNIITAILEDKNEVLWIATADGGMSRYNYRLAPKDQFRQYKHSASDSTSIPVNIINALVEDQMGYLWLATSGRGVLRFDKQKEIFSEPVARWPKTILAISIDHTGKLWVGREGGGLLKIDPRTMSYEEDKRYLDVYAKLPHMVVASLFPDSRNNMWMGSWDKVVYRVGLNDNTEDAFKNTGRPFSFQDDDPLSFAEDKHQRIWIGAKYNGLYIFHPVTQEFYQYKHDPSREGSLANNQVNCIYIDRSGIVWLGTNQGISIYDPSQQQFSPTFLPVLANNSNRTIYDFIHDEQKNLMIGTSDGLFIRLKGMDSIIHHPLLHRGEKLAVTKFFRDNNGAWYIGTNISLFKLNLQDYSLQLLPNTDKDIVMRRLIESRVVSMVSDTIENHPAILVSPYGHFITYYDFSLQQWVSRQDSVRMILSRFNIKDNLIRKFYKAGTGKIWVATTKSGLGEWTKNSLPRIEYHDNIPGNKSSISNNQVFDITEDVNGNLWVSTYGGGLHYFNTVTKKFNRISPSHNLGEGIQTDARGNVWIIANGNLHKFDPNRQSYTTYQLPDLDKTGGVRGYIFKNDSGMMYVAGKNYFIHFHPDSITDVNTQTKVFFTDFRIFNSSYSHLLSKKEIVLKYDQNFFSLEYSAPGYQAGFPVQYAHMLEGVDADWVEDGTQNTVNYTNLDGGDMFLKFVQVRRLVYGKMIYLQSGYALFRQCGKPGGFMPCVQSLLQFLHMEFIATG